MRMSVTNLASGTALIVLVAIGFATSAQDHQAAAQQAEQSGDLPRAISEYTSTLRDSISASDELRIREKAIDLCLKLSVKPAVPEEAKRRFVRGVTFAKLGKTQTDLRAAALEYHEGLKLAPCEGDAYFNYALLLEASNQQERAIEALKLYLRAAPDAVDAEKVRSKIYQLEAASEMKEGRKPAVSAKRALLRIPFAQGTREARETETAYGQLIASANLQWGPPRATDILNEVGGALVWYAPTSADPQLTQQMKALADSVNSRGGIWGRKLVIHE